MGLMDLLSGGQFASSPADMDYRLAQISDGFGALRDNGGGRRQAPAALQALQQEQNRKKATEALAAAQGAPGLPMGFNSPAFQAFASQNPEQALALMAKQSIAPQDPWAGTKTVGNNIVRNGPGGVETVYSAPEKAGDKARSAIAKLSQDLRDGLISQEDYDAARAKLLRDPNGITIGPDGTVQIGGTSSPKLTETESKGLIYFDRANAAEDILNKHQGQLTSITQNGASALPGVGNYLVSDEFQQAQQAGREFLAAVLRKDTGAAITQQEFDLYGPMYLPQPGDSEAVLEQKQKARKIAVDAIRKTLGKGGAIANPRTGEAAGPRKTINGVTYEQRNGKWGMVQ